MTHSLSRLTRIGCKQYVAFVHCNEHVSNFALHCNDRLS
jgi:hypothetical protein